MRLYRNLEILPTSNNNNRVGASYYTNYNSPRNRVKTKLYQYGWRQFVSKYNSNDEFIRSKNVYFNVKEEISKDLKNGCKKVFR